jgi:hypothetical protein
MLTISDLAAMGFKSIDLALPGKQWTSVDLVDLPLALRYRWYPTTRGKRGRRTTYVVATIFLHREILQPGHDELTEHRDGHGLNNRRSNLRPANTTQNAQNRRRRTDNTTGFKGVCFDAQEGKFRAMLTVNKKQTFLGYFDSAEQAGAVYDAAAKQHFGEFAAPNDELHKRN